MVRIVQFTTSALENIVRLGLGTYRKEDLGILFGHYMERRNGGVYYVESALPVTRRDRYPTSVNTSDEDDEKNAIMEIPLSSQTIGDIHYHVPNWDNIGWYDATVRPSQIDIDRIREFPYSLSLIVSIKQTNRITRPIIHDKIIGLCIPYKREHEIEKYNIKINGYYYEKCKKRVVFYISREQQKIFDFTQKQPRKVHSRKVLIA